MEPSRLIGLLLFATTVFLGQSCAADLTPEQKRQVVDLKQDLGAIRHDIERATKDDAAYSSGLIKSLLGAQLVILKTNEALVQQRIQALETGARIALVINATNADPAKATELATAIESQKARVAEARAQADRYSGGLVQAISASTVATSQNTLALLEQQYFIAKYGLALPSAAGDDAAPAETQPPNPPAPSPAASTAGVAGRPSAANCLKIATLDSSVLSANNTFTELAWKVDVSSSCAESQRVRVTFTIYDKDEFELDSDSENIFIPAGNTGKARGKMLVSPPEKARRMVRQGASIALR